MSANDPSKHLRALEEGYFMRQDAELIQRLREKEREAEEARLRDGHRGHCGHCGAGMQSWSHGDFKGHVCLECSHVQLAFDQVEQLVTNKAGRSAVYSLESMVRPKLRRIG